MTDANQTTPSAAPAPPPRRTRLFALGALGVALVAFLVIALGGIGENLVYYWGPTEMAAAGDKAVGATIRLGGLVAPGSVVQAAGVSGVEFDVIDRQGGRVHVKSKGVPPQMFREQIGVVVEGTMTRAGHFECHRLMVSHSNEYRVPGEAEKPEMRELMRTTEGLPAEAGTSR
jgi:cytochrome c-type biogenesis protein CcmE